MSTFRRCRHERLRCIHGDEIISTTRAWRRPTWARARCMDCGQARYDEPLPDPCIFTGDPHTHTTPIEHDEIEGH